MESENDAEPGPPLRLVTVNQVVAWNIAWFRREAGLTQAELADRLGWPPNKVGEAERSVTGKRTREFDAQTLIALSVAFGVPLSAFFLPPLDDGGDARYLFRPDGADEDLGMRDLLGAVAFGTEHAPGGALEAWRDRFRAAAGRYLDEGWQDEIAAWLRPLVGPEELEEGAYRLRGGRDQVLAAVAWLSGMADALEKAAGEEQ